MWLPSELPPTRLCRGSPELRLQPHLSPPAPPCRPRTRTPGAGPSLLPLCTAVSCVPLADPWPQAFLWGVALDLGLAWLGSAIAACPAVAPTRLCVPAALAHICPRHSSFRCFLPIFLISLGPFCVNFLCLLELTAPPSIASSAKFINV